ncbi:MAG: DUF4391 domain-containing protein [Caldilineaceae bacterium]|nr:DUF4391 domain-containing protein [Caldilineaceae bacterium]
MISSLVQRLEIPDSCALNKRVFKKLFEENVRLDATDKKALKDDVAEIRWLYTLKPATINIPRYVDQQRDYPEVAILLVTLASSTRVKRIADFMQRAIPYPLMLIFGHEDRVAFSLADKRINQADREKLVIETSLETEWIDLNELTPIQQQFLDDLSLKRLSFVHFLALYQDYCARVMALNCARYSGRYEVRTSEGAAQPDRVQLLREIEKVEQQQAELRNRLKKETQMGRQVTLNSEIHQLSAQMKEMQEAL